MWKLAFFFLVAGRRAAMNSRGELAEILRTGFLTQLAIKNSTDSREIFPQNLLHADEFSSFRRKRVAGKILGLLGNLKLMKLSLG